MREARKSDPLISVVVPVYKTEAELPRCLDSLIAQTYKNLEIILVDDGSPDSCGEICDAYAAKDERIQVIHQNNQGVSAARNVALDTAKGEYIGFVDSDDWVEPELYSFLYCLAEEKNCAITICGYFKHMMDGSVVSMDKPASAAVLEREAAIYYLLRGTYYDGYLWNKLFKRELFVPRSEDNRMNGSIHICEDLMLICSLMQRIDYVAYDPKPLYNYVVREGSALNTYNERRKTEFMAFTKIEGLLKKTGSSRNLELAIMRCAQTAVNHRIAALKAGEKVYACKMHNVARKYMRKLIGAKSICAKEKLRICVMHFFPEFSEKIWIPMKNRFHIKWSTWR